MRVVAGKAKGIPLKAPEGRDVRPTVDRLKETLFNMIQYDVIDTVVLDLFAGSGGLGIEALSRGAKKAFFCEKNKRAWDVLNENLQKTKLQDDAKVYFGDFRIGIQKIGQAGEKVDLVFLDPPYHETHLYQEALEAMLENRILQEDALIIAETTSGFDFSFLENYDTIQMERLKKFKTNQYLFIRFGSSE